MLTFSTITVYTVLLLSLLAACVVTTKDGNSWCFGDYPPTAPVTGCEELWYGASVCICNQKTPGLDHV